MAKPSALNVWLMRVTTDCRGDLCSLPNAQPILKDCMIDVVSAASLYVFIAVLGIPVILAGLIAGKLKLYQ